jgi:para-aminobenzoate synthetase component 1
LAVACFDSVLALDEGAGRLWLAARLPADRAPSGVLTTFERTRAIAAASTRGVPIPTAPLLPPPARVAAPAEYRARVAAIQAHLAAGEVYQVNLSRALRASWPGSPLALFTRHRALGRVPHGAYLDLGSGQAVAAFTPERFLRQRGRAIETSPIKGTRPRRATPAADRHQIEELRSSAKDRAEHLMIVDLERNDLGRVCVPGSIHVEPLFGVESYPSVHHLVSTVHGTLRPEVSPLALLRATFPGGSVTGAPKIRAIDLLRRLEGEPRHLYTGALGYWDRAGDLDLALPIRTALLAAGAIEYRVGGGIVIDSDPDAEWRETEDKALAFTQVLAGIESGVAPAIGSRR